MKKIINFFLKQIPRHHLHRVAHLALRLISPFYRGSAYEDPITGIKYRKMLPYGRVISRPNALAPDSMSLERHRMMWLFMKNRTNFFTENIKFLHLAPEYCFLKIFKKQANLDYVTGDLYSPWADIKMDVHDIPFPDNTFDAIIGNHLLEHVTDDAKVMSEFYRVMKPGGWGIFMVPLDRSLATTYEDPSITDPKERERHFGQDDHVRLYGLDYKQKLEKAGFKVTEEDYAETLGAELTKRYCLVKGDFIYFCQKA